MEYNIVTKKLLLRPYLSKDREYFIALNCDPMVRKKMDGPHSHQSASDLFDKICLTQNKENSLTPHEDAPSAWAILEKASGNYLGHTFLTKENDEGEEKKEAGVELGYLFFSRYWGRGFATEAVQAIVHFAFTKKNISRLYATVDCDHISSIRVLEKSGLTLESILEDEEGPYSLYSILATNQNLITPCN